MTFHSEAVHQYQLLKGSPHKDTSSSMLHCGGDAFIIFLNRFVYITETWIQLLTE